MTNSVFGSLGEYVREWVLGARTLARSIKAGVPYLFGWGEHRREVTEQYPDPVSSKTQDDLPPRTRGTLYNDINVCTGCQKCESACPVRCISIECDQGPDVNKRWVSIFDVDFSKCIYCGICVEVCPVNSLIHTKGFESAVYRRSDLVVRFGRGRLTEEQRKRYKKIRQSEEQL